jgi:nickel-type superoxide dismutase maturation protease
MEPTLRDGQRVLVWRTRRAPRVGEVWVLQHPALPFQVVKRVAAAHADGTFEVRGDHPRASADSAQFGPVERARFVGKVLCSYRPPARVR